MVVVAFRAFKSISQASKHQIRKLRAKIEMPKNGEIYGIAIVSV